MSNAFAQACEALSSTETATTVFQHLIRAGTPGAAEILARGDKQAIWLAVFAYIAGAATAQRGELPEDLLAAVTALATVRDVVQGITDPTTN